MRDTAAAPRSVRFDLDSLYSRYARPEFIHPDPLEFVPREGPLLERELVGLLASSLAYGRVGQILRSVGEVLSRLPAVGELLPGLSRSELDDRLTGFKHRFTTGPELAALLWGARALLEERGSLHAAFAKGVRTGDATVLPALERFVRDLRECGGLPRCHLLPSPADGSACKRLHLYIRWMVRADAVDPGGWDSVSPALLVVPLDTHMHRIALRLGLTRRRTADRRTALEVTEGFRRLRPTDPVRYDFALTRLGIRREQSYDALPRCCA